MTATVDEALLLAVAAHREGRLAEAAALYRAVLQAVPDHGDALHLLAVVRRRIDGPENATAAFARALAAVPGNAAVWRNYALLLADLGRSAAAPPSSSPLVPPL
ncbi:MAG TPA: hypothetical protein PKZ97_18180, partial [Azospirillaceae bacterium]|nr:hypothetical protein [Azospirillaceae bacterium]